GKRSAALNYFQQAARFSEALGNQQDAAWTQTNLAVILVDHGPDPDHGAQLAQDAMVVLEKLSDKNFEVLARRAIAMHDRHLGRREEAVRELTRARDIAIARNLEQRATQMDLELARLRFDAADYPGAVRMLSSVETRATGLDRIHARVELAR